MATHGYCVQVHLSRHRNESVAITQSKMRTSKKKMSEMAEGHVLNPNSFSLDVGEKVYVRMIEAKTVAMPDMNDKTKEKMVDVVILEDDNGDIFQASQTVIVNNMVDAGTDCFSVLYKGKKKGSNGMEYADFDIRPLS